MQGSRFVASHERVFLHLHENAPATYHHTDYTVVDTRSQQIVRRYRAEPDAVAEAQSLNDLIARVPV